jgi:DNA-binding NarL/FixJ family response regulator
MALDHLTATEARVAGLVAGGYSNPEITAELTLPPEALERHLREVYRKLGVGSRTELAVLLGAGGPQQGRKEDP